MPNPSQEPPPSSNSGLKGYGCSLHLQNHDREPKFGSWVHQRPVTTDHIQIKMSNPDQEPPASSKAPNQDLMDMGVLGTYKIMTEIQTSEHGQIKEK